jgi:hypothetical protein
MFWGLAGVQHPPLGSHESQTVDREENGEENIGKFGIRRGVFSFDPGGAPQVLGFLVTTR